MFSTRLFSPGAVGLCLALILVDGRDDAAETSLPATRFALASEYASVEELSAELKKHSTWPVQPYQYADRRVLFFSTMWLPHARATSYVLAVEHETGAVDVVDHGFFWQTAKDTRLADVRYDHDRCIVYYVDDHDRILGGKQIDLGVAKQSEKQPAKRPIPDPPASAR